MISCATVKQLKCYLNQIVLEKEDFKWKKKVLHIELIQGINAKFRCTCNIGLK